MNPTQKYVLWLQDITPDTSELSGGKATNLGELLKNGFPVPDGFVVTTLDLIDFSKQPTLDQMTFQSN
jgi:rifampicin phosphotransferase